MSKQSPYVKSNFPRVPGDHYPTVDTRCVDGLLHHFDMAKERIVDICAPQGSSIVDYLCSKGYKAWGTADAFAPKLAGKPTWIVTNTPYDRPLVDQIIRKQISRATSWQVQGVACLLRLNFDHAKTRADMF